MSSVTASRRRYGALPRSWLSYARLRLLLAGLGLAAGLGNLALNLTSDVEPIPPKARTY